MIYLDITGDDCPAVPDTEIKEAFEFAVKELMPRKKKLDVTIHLCDTGDSACAWHLHVEKYTHEIEINPKQTRDDFITALFHEMVHVRQCERNEPFDDTLPYYERQHEVEAYTLQEELWNRYQKRSIVKDTTTIC